MRGNHNYVAFMPRVAGYLRQNLEIAELKELRQWMIRQGLLAL